MLLSSAVARAITARSSALRARSCACSPWTGSRGPVAAPAPGWSGRSGDVPGAWGGPRPGWAELPVQDGDLVAQRQDLDVLVVVGRRQQPQ
jgi:hypothetical protein